MCLDHRDHLLYAHEPLRLPCDRADDANEARDSADGIAGKIENKQDGTARVRGDRRPRPVQSPESVPACLCGHKTFRGRSRTDQ